MTYGPRALDCDGWDLIFPKPTTLSYRRLIAILLLSLGWRPLPKWSASILLSFSGISTTSSFDFTIFTPENTVIVDDAGISQYIPYLVACRHSILIHKNGQQFCVRILSHFCFCRQLEYNQHLSWIIDSWFLVNISLIEANTYWWECTRYLTNSTLEVHAFVW